MTNVQRITERMEATGRTRGEGSIYSVVMDDHHVQCLTEPMLDVWWHELKPEDKAALYEMHLDGVLDKQQPKPKVKIDIRCAAYDATSAELAQLLAGVPADTEVCHESN
jgi:hypothetical protein